jgi:regulator of protease activity HflC (stomatin/prohibitin superfamily)
VHPEHIVPRTERISSLATTTVDGKSIGFDAVITYRISDIQKAVLEVEDLKDAIADSCAGTIGQTLSAATWEQIWKGEATDSLTTACRKKGWRWGVEIQSVQLTGVALIKNLRIVSSGKFHA